MTKVFISWSGEKSRLIAAELRDWLPSVIQSIEPYFTPQDIDKGAKWESNISGQLDETNFGIVCLTRENQHAPWIMYEAGALSKNVEESRLGTILIDLGPADVKGPLTRYQHAQLNKKDFKRLIEAINRAGGDRALKDKTLSDVFETFWPKLEAKTVEILAKDFGATPVEPTRSSDDILEEILVRVRRLEDQPNTSNRFAEVESLEDKDRPFSVGDLVYHQKFGAGIVVELFSEEHVQVNFVGNKIKKVVASYLKHYHGVPF